MSFYGDRSQEYYSETYPKSLSNLALSKLETKLVSQRGSSSLLLGDSFIGDEGCQIVSQFVRDNPTFQHLELRGNNISGLGLRYLSTCLRGPCYIKGLSLEWNNLGDSLSSLADSLAYNESVKFLDLRNNRIGPDGASHLARMLETNSSITKIDLRWNEIGARGARALVEVLKKPSKLESLELSGNKVPDELLQEIETCLRHSERTNGFTSPPRKESRQTFEFEDIHSKYETIVLTNARNEARINELEMMLDQESRRMQDLKNDFQKELEHEKSRRAYAEESFVIYKEEVLQKEAELTRSAKDLESKVSKLNHEKSQLEIETENLRDLLDKHQYSNQEKTKQMEEKLNYWQKSYRNLEDSSRASLEKTRKDLEYELDELNSEYQSRMRGAEDTIKSLRKSKENLELEAKELKQQISNLKLQHEEELQELERDLREKEGTRYDNAVKHYEDKIKNYEEERENLISRNNQVQKEMLLNDQRANENISDLENSINTLREEKLELQRQLQKLHSNIESLKNEIYITNSSLERSNEEKEELNNNLQETKQVHMNQLEKVSLK